MQSELPTISDESLTAMSPSIPLKVLSKEVEVDIIHDDRITSQIPPSLPEHPSRIEDVVKQSTSILPLANGTLPAHKLTSSPEAIISLESSTSTSCSKTEDDAAAFQKPAVSTDKTEVDQSLPTALILTTITASSSEKRKKQQDSEVRPKKKRKTETSPSLAAEEISLPPTKASKGKVAGKRKAEEQHDSENTPEVDAAPKAKKKRATADASMVASTSAAAPSKRVSKNQRSRIRASSIYYEGSDEEAPDQSQPLDAETIALHAQVCGLLIETMAMSRASSLPVSSLFKLVMQQQPALKSQRTDKEWMKLFDRVLHNGEAGRGSGLFGKVESSGKVRHLVVM